MRWFRCTNSIYYGGGSSTARANNVVVGPVYYNGKLYGTEFNTMYSAYLYGSILNQTYQISPVDGYDITYHYQRVVGVTDDRDLTSSWGEELDNDIINGKYKFGTSISGTIYGGWSIPINFSITKTNGDIFNGNRISSVGYNDRSPSTKFCGVVFSNVIENTSISIGNTSDTSSTLTDEMKDFIVDFGNNQNIPKFIKEWFDNNAEQIYDGSITIYNNIGNEILSSIDGTPNIVSCSLTYIGNTRTANFKGTNGRYYNINWDSTGVEGKTFSGLSLSANSKILNIPVGQEVNINLSGNIQLYEVYGTSRPILTSFSINLYNNTAERNRVDKTNYITEVGTLNGVLRDESSLIDMVITFESVDIPTFNYIYIEAFNRYYFVNDISSIRYKLWEMSVSVDSLMTYKNAILACNGFIDRNEFSKNPYIIDNLRPIRSGNTISYTAVPNDLFTTTYGTYILTGLGLLIDIPTESSEGGEDNV